MRLDAMILVSECWILSQLFHSLSPPSRGSLVLCSAIRVVSSAYLRLLISLLAILIPACDSSSLAFHMMYPACKLNKQGDNIQLCTPFSILNQSVPCKFVTVASWPTDRFLRSQVRWFGIPIHFRIFQFVVIHTVKGFSTVNEAEVDVFWNSLAFSMMQQMLAIWSVVPLPFLNPAFTSGILGSHTAKT